MKVIDLLNKIANGEIDRNNKYQFSRDDYCTINDFFARYIVDEENLNLEIIEEPQEHKIPKKIKLSSHYGGNFVEEQEFRNKRDDEITRKINEILDYLEEIE